MSTSIEALWSALESLSSDDFDEWSENANGWERLAQLCDELRQYEDIAILGAPLFRFLERMDGVNIGSPGPVVHLLEALPGYEGYLKESLRRRPTQLTLWMANRILNGPSPDRQSWMDLLIAASTDESLAHATREDAREFFSYQAGRD